MNVVKFSDFAYAFIIPAGTKAMLVQSRKRRMLALDNPSLFPFLNNFFNSWQPNFTFHSPKKIKYINGVEKGIK